MIELFLDIIFPQNACCLCQKPGNYWSRKPWCDKCEADLRRIGQEMDHCHKCGKYLKNGGTICSECEGGENPFFISQAVGPYEGCFRKIIKNYKFMGNRRLSIRMAELMAETITRIPEYQPIDAVVPVPISKEGLRERGFNQSELLARRLSKILKIEHLPHALHRVKATLPQRELCKEDREKNLLGAFAVKEKKNVRGKNILLVDDVYTTGSTAKECAKTLLEAGAMRVCVITWASGKGY
ncbi:MAG: ComF family protein [Candidatus Saccharibacteria bacterium]